MAATACDLSTGQDEVVAGDGENGERGAAMRMQNRSEAEAVIDRARARFQRSSTHVTAGR